MPGKRVLVRIGYDFELPLLGCICFGVIDRGTNLLQVRPVSGCNLCCPFCSVDEGPCSKTRVARYEVALDYLLDFVRSVARFKGERLELHIDGCGEPTLYPKLVELIQGLSEIEGVSVISMQTNGTLLTEEKIKELSDAGLSRMNLSINAFDEQLAKMLAGTEKYELSKVLDVAKAVAESKTDLLIAPVWLKSVNDDEIQKLVEFARSVGAGRRCPPLGIQKYEAHKLGRKMSSVSLVSWKKFYEWLRNLEMKLGTKLVLSPQDFGIEPRRIIPTAFRRFETVQAEVVAQGWLRNEKLAVARERTITLINAEKIPLGSVVKVRIIETKHNLYLGRVVG